MALATIRDPSRPMVLKSIEILKVACSKAVLEGTRLLFKRCSIAAERLSLNTKCDLLAQGQLSKSRGLGPTRALSECLAIRYSG